MRRLTWLALAILPLAALATLPGAEGQAAPDLLRVAEDPEGDSEVTAGGQGTGQDRWAASDLVALDVAEDAQGLRLTLSVRGLGAETTTLVDDVDYTLDLMAGDAPYRIEAYYIAEDGLAFATWCAPGDGPFYRCFEELAVALDAAAGTFTFTVPHALLVALDGSQLLRGDAVSAFTVQAQSRGASVVAAETAGAVDSRDRMPDTGVSAVAWAIRTGVAQTGHLVLGSPSPVRVSNGEATTILFEVDIKNTLDRRDTALLAASGTLDIWVVTFPVEEVRIEAGETATVPVLVTVPFNHQHGTFHPFNVTATSRSDPLAVGQITLGIRYTRVPQPAGHHDTLWLHQQGSYYVNTLEEEEIPSDEDASGGLGGGCSFSGGSVSGSSELVSLVPRLDLGLDAAMERTGLARLQLRSDTPVLGTASVGGYFVTWMDDEYPETCVYEAPPTTVMAIERSAPLTMEADTPITVELPIRPLPYGDRIEFDPRLNFGLVLVVYEESGSQPVCCFDVGAPVFMEGSSFQLPLDEYHDPVDEYFSTLSGIDLAATSEQQRLVNAGETAVFRVEAQNIGTKSASFRLELTGSNTDWARILGDDHIAIPAGAIRELAVAVTAPAGASSGELADVTLHAVKSDDENVRSLIRLLATVDETADHPDDSDEVEDLDKDLTSADAPAVPWVAALAALAAVAARRRR